MCTDKEGPSGDAMSLANTETFEDQHTAKFNVARLERERISVEEKITSLLPSCKQYRSTADKYAKEIQDREQVIHIHVYSHSNVYAYNQMYTNMYMHTYN